MTEILFAALAVVYGLVGIFLLVYTDRLSKQLKQHEEDKRKHRGERDCLRPECKVIDAPTQDPQPLLGVAYPLESEK
jgi:hypothetical protein